MSKVPPVLFTFSVKDIRDLRLDAFQALFTHAAVCSYEGGRALLNSVYINLDMGRKVDVLPCEIPWMRKFCRRLVWDCPVLPWVAFLGNEAYQQIVYASLNEAKVVHHGDGKYEITYRVAEMDALIARQIAQMQYINDNSGYMPPEILRGRVEALTAYLKDEATVIA